VTVILAVAVSTGVMVSVTVVDTVAVVCCVRVAVTVAVVVVEGNRDTVLVNGGRVDVVVLVVVGVMVADGVDSIQEQKVESAAPAAFTKLDHWAALRSAAGAGSRF